MKTKRMISLLLAVLLTLSVAVTPAFAASAGDLLPAAESADVEESNDVVSIRLTTSGELVYGSPFTLSVVTKPADTQYIGVVIGTKGEAKGYVTLVLSDKIRTLLKMIPLPRKMSATPDQQEEFNLYAYIKQLIDGNDVSVLLRVADEVVSVMDVLQFYMPTIKDVSTGLKLALALIRKFLPDGAFSRIYVDEQPTESGSYVAGAVALESGDVNTAGVAMFRIKPKTEGVRAYWAQEVPATMTVEEAQNYDLSAVLEVDGQPVPETLPGVLYSWQRLTSSQSSTSSAVMRMRYSAGSIWVRHSCTRAPTLKIACNTSKITPRFGVDSPGMVILCSREGSGALWEGGLFRGGLGGGDWGWGTSGAKNAELSTSMVLSSSCRAPRRMCREVSSGWEERSFSSNMRILSFDSVPGHGSGHGNNGQHGAGRQTGRGLVFFPQPAVMLTDVVRAGGVHKAGGSVLHLHVHGQVAGVHIVGGILGQRDIQHRVGVAVGQGSG